MKDLLDFLKIRKKGIISEEKYQEVASDSFSTLETWSKKQKSYFRINGVIYLILGVVGIAGTIFSWQYFGIIGAVPLSLTIAFFI